MRTDSQLRAARPGRTLLAALACLLALTIAGAHAAKPKFVLSKVVHREKSMYRNILIAEGDGHRCITFGRRNLLQTCIEIATPLRQVQPYTRGMFTTLLANPDADSALVIGLGGGVIPMGLRQIKPDMRIDTVELDPAVQRMAERYFFFRQDARMRAHVGDGRVFARRRLREGARYDLIVVDACDNTYFPEHMATLEFMQELKGLLNPGGVIAFNGFAYESRHERLFRHEGATYQAVFGEIRTVTMAYNRLVLVGRDGLPSQAELEANARALRGPLARIGIDADALARRIVPHPRIVGARPLTDQYAPVNLLIDF